MVLIGTEGREIIERFIPYWIQMRKGEWERKEREREERGGERGERKRRMRESEREEREGGIEEFSKKTERIPNKSFNWFHIPLKFLKTKEYFFF